LRKITALLLTGILLVSLGLSGCSGSSGGLAGGGSQKLSLYNWTEYIPPEVYDLFEDETGIRVVESTFSSNEEMLAKLEAGGTEQYDLIVPSNYVINLMKEKGFIQPIDKSKIENFKNISPSVLNRDFDPDNVYSIPYMATMTLIAVNTDKMAELGVTITSLNDLLNPALANNLVVLDDSRELVGAALKATGKDVDTRDKATIQGTLPWLKELKKNVKTFDSDSSKTALATNEVAAGLVYNIDAGQAIGENSAIAVVYTTEPCEAAIDNFVITSTAKNKENAETFISFIHRPDIYKMILDEFPGICLNDAAKELLDSDYLDNPGGNVDAKELSRAHFIADIGDAAAYYDEVFTQMKAE
jgi:spermidine/putrescine-binding protein